MEIRLPKELSLFFWCFTCHKIQVLKDTCVKSTISQDLPTTEVATNGTDKSWGVVEDLAISCALKLGGAPGLQ